MRLFTLSFAIAGGLAAQESAPVGIVQGRVSLLMIRAGLGSLDITTDAGTLYQCGFDSTSLIEREHIRIPAAEIADKEKVELVVDRKRGRCFARIIRVLGPAPVAAASGRPRVRPPLRPFETLFPRGNLTFAGIVLRTSPAMIVLRTRAEPEKVIMLRDDTRFLEDGVTSELKSLAVNTRVFVRGMRTFDDEIQAFQVVWGEIEGPKPRESF